MDNISADKTISSWHFSSADDVLQSLASPAETGLSSSEVKTRQEKYGLNVLTPKKGTPAWIRFLLQFHQPLVYILLIAAAVTAFLQEWVDSSVIFGVVFINAVIGFLQEAKAIKALDALARSMKTFATVVRDGKESRISSVDLVPGDIVIVSSGDKVSADMRLLASRDLSVNESALTGESVAVEKRIDALPVDAVLADRKNMIYASTFVTYGQGRGVVVATGDRTEVGRISELISTAEDLRTPLTIKIAEFSQLLLYVILGLAFVTFLVGILRGNLFVDMFMAAVALAVGAIPEGLPAAVTITLAIGVARMAKRQAIIRKLPAVETLGSTGVICSDKTGTLTENQMTVQMIFTDRAYEVTGVGYSSDGEIKLSDKAAPKKALQECLRAGLLCNDSRVVEQNGLFHVEGDPTEGALIVAANKGRAIFKDGIFPLKRLDSIPFESEYQYMATLHVADDKARVIYIKGSLEKILAKCKDQLAEDGKAVGFDRAGIEKQAEQMASQGLRVLALARLPVPGTTTRIDHSTISDALTFLGLQAMIDPARREAVEAVQSCHTAGIRVKMITGDHVLTARAIAKNLGLRKDPYGQDPDEEIIAMSGKDIDALSDAELREKVAEVSVFARVTPEQKLRLVKAIQSRGYVTAMTGDGVNDAPALKQANIGVAMGRAGTEVAKEAADMVLLDDNFASIEAAVEEGRCVFDNLRKFIVWSLPTNLAEALAILVAIFLGTGLPIVPVQILWINMTTAICLGLMLAFEPKEPGIMERPPVDPQLPIMTKGLIWRTFAIGILIVAGVFILFNYENSQGASLAEARTAAVNVLVFGELFYLFNCRSMTKSVFALGLFSNVWVILGVVTMVALQILFTYAPFMNRFFHSAPIRASAWVEVILVGLTVYVFVEAVKFFRFGKKNKNS